MTKPRRQLTLNVVACIVAAVLITGGIVLKADTAFAAGQCSTFDIDWVTGAQTTTGDPYGVRARIEGRTPALCTGGLVYHTFSSNWVGLLGGDSGDGWVQVGYERFKKQNGQVATRKFSQWTRCAPGCRYNTKRHVQAVGPLEMYTVVYNFATNKTHMIAGRRRMDNTKFDPYAVWGTPFSTHLKTETRYCETDIIGTQADAAEYSSIQTRRSNHSWGAPPGDLELFAQCSRYHILWGNQPGLFYVWTHPL